VNRFAALLDALLFTPSRNGKLRLMQEYFASQPDPERGWALAALTGELSFAEAKPNQVRALAAARVDPELLGWSYDFVGDLAETVSLIWPAPTLAQSEVPSLTEIVERLHQAGIGLRNRFTSASRTSNTAQQRFASTFEFHNPFANCLARQATGATY